VFWVISVYLNIRNTLPKSGTFLLGHPVYVTVSMKQLPFLRTEKFLNRSPGIFLEVAVGGTTPNLTEDWTSGESFISGSCKKCFSLPKCPTGGSYAGDELVKASSLLFNLVTTLRMCGAVPPFLYTLSRRRRCDLLPSSQEIASGPFSEHKHIQAHAIIS